MTGNSTRKPVAHSAGQNAISGRLARSVWTLLLLAGTLLLGGGIANVSAADKPATNALKSVQFAALPGNKAQIVLTMSNTATQPLSFTIDNPARIALDFPGTRDELAQRTQTIGIGMAESMTAVEAQGRTRVVVNLTEMVPYEAHAEGNKVILTVQGGGKEQSVASATVAAAKGTARPEIKNVDFRRGEHGEGRVIVTLSDPSIPVDIQQQGGNVVVDFYRAQLPAQLARRLDVLDFATPVKTIDTLAKGDNVHMVITPTGEYDYLAYQSNDEFTIEVKPLTKEEAEEKKKDEFGYKGERLSLNFQDIEVRSVLQLIADFTGINIVVSDSVKGSLTLRLKNVPWDQALDIILKTKGLAMRQTGNVMLVAPSEEIAAREKLELEAQKQIKQLEPLYSEFVQINYAKAATIAKLLKTPGASLLSERGTVTIDERTNTLLVQDIASKLADIRKLVAKLDIPVRQVLIESRIVIADNNFTRDLGVKFGYSKSTTVNGDTLVIGGKQPGDLITNPVTPFEVPAGSGTTGLITDLGVAAPSGSIGLAIGKLGSHLLQLELNAMEAEGQGEVISSPRVLTSNQKEAFIEAGQEIPYQEATSSGATSTSFKKAVLSLKVTPQITPDDRIIMDLNVNKDSVGQTYGVGNPPSINTQEVGTQVLVDNGETLVLGGIYQRTTRNDVDRVPFFGELPMVDWLFKRTHKLDTKEELLIFITPKIVKENFHL